MEKGNFKAENIYYAGSNIDFANNVKEFKYLIDRGLDSSRCVISKYPMLKETPSSHKIIEYSDFSHGYMVVKFDDGTYGYMDKHNHVRKERFDYASNFNEYGFAMVAKSGQTNFIDENFNYLYFHEENHTITRTKLNENCTNFTGFKSVHEFSHGDYPLARLHFTTDGIDLGSIVYMTPYGDIQHFQVYNGKFDTEDQKTVFENIDFKDKDYIITHRGILFSKGYFCPMAYLEEYVGRNNSLNALLNHVDKSFKISQK